MTKHERLLRAWGRFLQDYVTEGCPNPQCLVCRRSREAKAEMEAAIKEVVS